jgi:hypothetical protein
MLSKQNKNWFSIPVNLKVSKKGEETSSISKKFGRMGLKLIAAKAIICFIGFTLIHTGFFFVSVCKLQIFG